MFIFCFPENSTVITPNGPKSMKLVKVGDDVKTVTTQGQLVWSKVVGWLHKEPARQAPFLRISTSTRQLHVSDEHLVAVVLNGQISFVQAKEIQPGTILLECDVSNGSTPVWGNAVQQVERVTMSGVYAPLTDEGTIVVDGVGASCYASTHSHKAAHTAMKPMRHLYRHNPEKMQKETRVGKHVPGAHKYVDLLARAAGKV